MKTANPNRMLDLFSSALGLIVLTIPLMGCPGSDGTDSSSEPTSEGVEAGTHAPQPTCTAPESGSIEVALYSQQNSRWCWAAATQMIAGFFGLTVTQCELAGMLRQENASQTLGAPADINCCVASSSTTSFPCDRMNAVCDWLGHMMFEEVELTYDPNGAAPLTWDTLAWTIACERTPMGYMYGPSGGVNHIVVIKGYAVGTAGAYLIVNDPACGAEYDRQISLTEYLEPVGSYAHKFTWHHIHRNS